MGRPQEIPRPTWARGVDWLRSWLWPPGGAGATGIVAEPPTLGNCSPPGVELSYPMQSLLQAFAMLRPPPGTLFTAHGSLLRSQLTSSLQKRLKPPQAG